MRGRRAALLACALLCAACDGSDKESQDGSGGFPAPRGCSTLTAADIQQVTGRRASRRDLAPSPEDPFRCSSGFFAGGSELVVGIKMWDGGARRLRRLRRELTRSYGRSSSPSGLGDDAFAAGGRIIGFRRRDAVIMLETGYSGRKLILRLGELERLARLVAGRN
jgi:hypothetical protein